MHTAAGLRHANIPHDMPIATLQGVVVVVRTTTSDSLSGAVIAINEFTIFALGAGTCT